MKFNLDTIKAILLTKGEKLIRRPRIVAISLFLAGGLFLLFVWWQYIFKLDFYGEAIGGESVGLRKADLNRVVEIIEKRQLRFETAPQQEYRNLFP